MDRILENLNIVLTRAEHQSVSTIEQLENLGAKVYSFPTIKIESVLDNNSTNFTISRINDYNTIIFTSANAVRSLLNIIDNLKINFDPQAFFVISIGDKTSRICSQFGFRVDFQSNSATSSDLLKELGYIDLVGRKILVPSSNLSQLNQFNSLEDHGAEVNTVIVYRNLTNDRKSLSIEINQLQRTNIDLYIFTSPSTFKGFLQILNIKDPLEYFNNSKTAVIGPVTKKALQDHGIEPDIIPSNFSINYLIEEIKNFYSNEEVE